MKKLGLLIAVFAAISCNNKTGVDYAIFSGKIKNKAATEVTINGMNGEFKEVIEVAEDGSFVDSLRIDPGTYVLIDGKNKALVYLEPGYNINVYYNTIDFLYTLTFNGVGSETSTYLVNKGVKKNEILGNPVAVYELEEDEYKAKFKEIKAALTKMITVAEGIPEDFKEKELRNIHYAYLTKLSIYQMYHAQFAKKPGFKTSEGFLNELKDLDYNNEEDFLFSSDYKKLVAANYRAEAFSVAIKDSIPNDLAILKSLETIENETIKNELLINNAKYGIARTQDVEKYYNAFMAASTNEKNNKVITEIYNKLMAFSKGQPSPKFVDYENYAGGTTSLDDLKGKYVYVNVWATWYGPCVEEIPFLKEVEKKYHRKSIVFINISVDKVADHAKWKKMIEEKEMGGIQLFADKGAESDFITDYMIKNIPRYILIDPDGNIVNSNAPKPSDIKLIDLFNKLDI